MAAPVGVEAQLPAMLTEHLQQSTECHGRALLRVRNAESIVFVASSIVTIMSTVSRVARHSRRNPSWLSIIPANERRHRLRRWAPRHLARTGKPFDCRNAFVQAQHHVN
jgi:hypothetical protein